MKGEGRIQEGRQWEWGIRGKLRGHLVEVFSGWPEIGFWIYK